MERHFYLLTGVMASGKSTTAQALAERLPRCVHLRGDVFRKMIVTGREEMSSQPTPQALEQLGLRYRLAAQAARGYWEAGFSVVLQDNYYGPDLANMVALLGGHPRAGGGALPRCGDCQGPGGSPGQNRLRGLCACPPAGGVPPGDAPAGLLAG